MALLVEQEVIFHKGEFAGLQCKPFDSRDSCPGAPACLCDVGAHGVLPYIKICQLAQCRDLVDTGKVVKPIRRSRQQCPRSEKRQLMEGSPALTGEVACPPRGLVLSAGAHSIVGIDAG